MLVLKVENPFKKIASICIIGSTKNKKTGKLLTSHRYNHTPLLHSCPGGFSGSWPYKTCQDDKGKAFFCSGNIFFEIFLNKPKGALIDMGQQSGSDA